MTFEPLLTHPAVQALGASLLHFLWQGALLAALLWAVTARSTNPRFRYVAACVILASMPLALAATFVWQYPASTPLPSAPRAVAAAFTAAAPAVPAAPVAQNFAFTSWIVCFWIAGVVLLSLRAAGGWMRAQRLRYRATQSAPPAWQKILGEVQQRIRVSRPVRLCASAIVEVPTVIGWMRPVILLPLATAAGLSEFQLRAILAHELAHIRRHDYLVNLIQTAVETLLFYHPAVWWIGRTIRNEREHCADDLAVNVCGDASEYAGALLQLEELRGAVPEPALGATGGDLLGRVRRLLGSRPPARAPKSLAAAAVALTLVSVIAAPLLRTVEAAPQEPVEPQTIPQVQPEQGKTVRVLVTRPQVAQAKPATPPPAAAKPSQSANQNVPESTQMLIKLFDATRDGDEKRHLLDLLSTQDNQAARDKISTVARTESNMDLRRHAMDLMFTGAESYETLVAMFDSTTDPDLRRHALDLLSSSSDRRVLDKLFSIAQSDPSGDLRRHAMDLISSR